MKFHHPVDLFPRMSDTNGVVLADIRRVTYTHWNQSTPTLHDLSLQIYRRTLTVLVGPGGSGKSTLCDLFNGVIPHLNGGKFTGDVFIDGNNTRERHVKELSPIVGRVFQDPETMFATLYVDDEIAFGPENLRYDVPEIKATVERLLQTTDLQNRRHHLVWNLSGGQIQKLGLATVLAMQPQLIILDEPTANLDPRATRDVHDLVLALRSEGITVVLVTRELDDFLAEADQLVVMEEGRIKFSGHPRTVLEEHGAYLVAHLGVWLPETTEIGIALRAAGGLQDDAIPITVEECVNALLRIQGSTLGQFTQTHTKVKAPGRTGELLVSARDVRWTYPGGTTALDGVSLDIYAGEMLAIVGRNGAGKSTLAKLLVGLLRTQEGELTLLGKSANEWKVPDLATYIALVLQNPEHQFLTDSVSDEIRYSLLARDITAAADVRQHTSEILALLGLEEVADVHPFALSAGLKRRLGVATMLVGDPRILIVDEPTYGQDKQMTRTLMERMREIRARGIALVMITHDMRLVEEYAERVIVMSHGRVLYDDSVTGLFERDDILQTANLRPTLLHRLTCELRRCGVSLPGEVRTTTDLLRQISLELRPIAGHGR